MDEGVKHAAAERGTHKIDHTKHKNIRFYITNGCVTRNNLDYRSHHSYFMVYAATTGVILTYEIELPPSVR